MLTCALLAHSNVMKCLCSPHARMASRRWAPTLMSMSPTLGRRQGVGRPRSCPCPPRSDNVKVWGAHADVHVPHARTASRRGAPPLMSMSPTRGRRQGGELPRIACPSQGYHQILTCALISHSNVMLCLCIPHARTASKRGAPTLRSISPPRSNGVNVRGSHASPPLTGNVSNIDLCRVSPLKCYDMHMHPPRTDGVKAWGAHALVHLPPRSDAVKAWGSHASHDPQRGSDPTLDMCFVCAL
jgi:hypothetical protein